MSLLYSEHVKFFIGIWVVAQLACVFGLAGTETNGHQFNFHYNHKYNIYTTLDPQACFKLLLDKVNITGRHGAYICAENKTPFMVRDRIWT